MTLLFLGGPLDGQTETVDRTFNRSTTIIVNTVTGGQSVYLSDGANNAIYCQGCTHALKQEKPKNPPKP